MPQEPSDLDYPVPRPAAGGRVPLLAAAVVGVVLLGWLGSRVLSAIASPPETPIARPTPFPERTAISRATQTPEPAVSVATPEATPESATPARTAPPATPRIVRATRTPAPERSTPRPTEAPAVQFGVVTINTSPWSEVRSGGKLLGTTPLRNVRFPAGRHVLSFRNPVSGVERNIEVDVRPNETRTFLFDLSR